MTVPSTGQILTDWSFEPSVVAGLLLVAAGYWYAVGPYRRRHEFPAPTRRQITLFVLSELVVAFALLSPLDEIGDTYLFSAHMVQHLLLASLWPPLVLLSLPGWLVRPVFSWPVVGGLATFLVYPVISIMAFNLDMYFWHVPYFYDATLTNENVHILEHLTFMFFGLVTWWPILSPILEQRLSPPFQILYLVAEGMLMMALAIVLTFADIIFYHPYAVAPRLWGISAQSDQQIGGLIMWYPGNLPYAVALVIAFFKWFDQGGPVGSAQYEVARPTQ